MLPIVLVAGLFRFVVLPIAQLALSCSPAHASRESSFYRQCKGGKPRLGFLSETYQVCQLRIEQKTSFL